MKTVPRSSKPVVASSVIGIDTLLSLVFVNILQNALAKNEYAKQTTINRTVSPAKSDRNGSLMSTKLISKFLKSQLYPLSTHKMGDYLNAIQPYGND